MIAFGGSGPRLASVHPGVDPDRAREATGFPMKVGDEVPVTEPPRPEEIAAMEELDPHGLRGVETRDSRADALPRMVRLLEESHS